jgi:transglutaminase-like putative cysteine protease
MPFALPTAGRAVIVIAALARRAGGHAAHHFAGRAALGRLGFCFFVADADASAAISPGRPLLAGAMELMNRIHKDFRYDTTVTDATTPVDRVFEIRAGVCQDLAHVGIAAMRSIGLPARYVSGYLLTQPPPGMTRMLGADASHAWFSVWAPPFGWVDLDPTNNVLVSETHVTASWGRDYGDVAPVGGIILGGHDHVVDVGVDVIPVDQVAP